MRMRFREVHEVRETREINDQNFMLHINIMMTADEIWNIVGTMTLTDALPDDIGAWYSRIPNIVAAYRYGRHTLSEAKAEITQLLDSERNPSFDWASNLPDFI